MVTMAGEENLSVFTTVFIYAILLCFLIYIYICSCFEYWNKLNVPTLKPSIPFGNIGNPLTRTRAFYESVAEVYNQYKNKHKYAGFYTLTQPYFIPIDNELIKNILIRDFPSFINRGLYYNEVTDPLSANLFFIGGHKWRVLRQKLTPTFTSAKMNKMFDILVECSQHLVDKLERYNDDVRELLACYSTEVIGSCAFGLDCGSLQDPNAQFRQYTRKLFEYSPWKTLQRMAQLAAPKLSKLFGLRFIPKDVSDFFMMAVEDTINMRKAKGIKRNDFLELLLELEQEGLLDKKDFAAQSFVFFVAGFETSSTTLAYLLYELSKNLDIQDKCREEIMKTMVDGKMTYEKVTGMKYLDQLVEETLRVYPVLPFLNRECTEDYVVNETLTLKKGMKLIIPTLGIHMDEKYFKEPEVFNPSHFSRNTRETIPSCVYMPFGEGPRKCIGNRFGLMQVKVGIVAIISKYKITKNPVTVNKLKWDTNSFTLKARKGIFLDFEKLPGYTN